LLLGPPSRSLNQTAGGDVRIGFVQGNKKVETDPQKPVIIKIKRGLTGGGLVSPPKNLDSPIESKVQETV